MFHTIIITILVLANSFCASYLPLIRTNIVVGVFIDSIIISFNFSMRILAQSARQTSIIHAYPFLFIWMILNWIHGLATGYHLNITRMFFRESSPSISFFALLVENNRTITWNNRIIHHIILVTNVCFHLQKKKPHSTVRETTKRRIHCEFLKLDWENNSFFSATWSKSITPRSVWGERGIWLSMWKYLAETSKYYKKLDNNQNHTFNFHPFSIHFLFRDFHAGCY